MDPESAALWLNTLLAGALALWSLGAWLTWRTRAVIEEPIVGELQLEVAPADVLERVTRMLEDAQAGSPFAHTELDQVTRDEVRWHSPTGMHRHRGILRVSGSGHRTRVSFDIHYLGRAPQLATAVVAAGLVVTLTLYFVLREAALPHVNAGARGQVLQMAQAIHLLWPPFLFIGLARGLRRAIARELERTLRNLATAAATTMR